MAWEMSREIKSSVPRTILAARNQIQTVYAVSLHLISGCSDVVNCLFSFPSLLLHWQAIQVTSSRALGEVSKMAVDFRKLPCEAALRSLVAPYAGLVPEIAYNIQ